MALQPAGLSNSIQDLLTCMNNRSKFIKFTADQPVMFYLSTWMKTWDLSARIDNWRLSDGSRGLWEPAPFFANFAARLCVCVVVGSVTLEESVATSISFESVRSLSIADSHCGHLQLDLLSLLDPGSVDPENPIAGRRLSSRSFSHSVSLSHSGFEFLGGLCL